MRTFDGKLSGPVFSNISFRRAIEPLPDTGRTIMNDTSSSGIPIFERNGAHTPETASARPLAENIVTAVIRMTSAGRSPMPECRPSFAPSRNAPGISLRENAQQSPKTASRAGIISSAKYVINHLCAVFSVLRMLRKMQVYAKERRQKPTGRPSISRRSAECPKGFCFPLRL